MNGRPLRIGLATPYSWTVPGGVNAHVEQLAAELERRGHRTWVLAPVGVVVGRRRVDSRRVHSAVRLAPMGTSVPIRSNGSFAYLNVSPGVVMRMDRTIRELRLDVLHVHEPFTPSVAMAAVLLAASPVVGTFHAATADTSMYDRWAWLNRIIADHLDARIAVSDAALEVPADRYPGDYLVIPNGIRTSSFVPARDMPKVPGRILFIGRAEPRKGLAVLLSAFAALRGRRPEATLVVAGATRRQVLAEAALAGDGVPIGLDGVTALGFVGHAEKVRRLGEAELVCAPSLHGESFGVVLVEAMAAGTPVVASDLPGYRSVVRHGVAGRLAPPGDPVALSHALEDVLDDQALRQRLRSSGLAVAAEHDWQRVAGQLEEVYRHVASLDLPRGRHGQPGRPWFGKALFQYYLWKARNPEDISADDAPPEWDGPESPGPPTPVRDADAERHASKVGAPAR